MTCIHCEAVNSPFVPFTRPVEGGRAYAQICAFCGHVLGMRPYLETDPPPMPCDLTEIQAARLEFLLWRLRGADGPQLDAAA